MSDPKVPGRLSKHGYSILKHDLDPDELCNLKQTLTAKPLVDTKYVTDDTLINYPVYIETVNKIYIPKMFGINKFGKTNESSSYSGQEWDRQIDFNGSLFDYQIEPVDKLIKACREHGGGILSLATGLGKCHAYNTPILMYDGSIKMVQDIIEGDLLMGDDSTPRRVLSLARGQDEMYNIIPVKGEKYTVNQEHILCLKNTKKEPWIEIRIQNKITKYDVHWWQNNKENSKVCDSINEANKLIEKIKNIHQNIVEISVKDYLKQTKTFKHHFKSYRVPIQFFKKNLPIDPYMIGYWLGDGTSVPLTLALLDDKVLYYFAKNLPQYNLFLDLIDKCDYKISSRYGQKNNLFLQTLKDLKMINNKHIPYIYKCNSRENRLKLLAGLLDSDGSLTNDKCTFNFIQKSEKLTDDVVYLCRSLGFACYKSKENYYFRINISGNIDEIPTLCPRKKAKKRIQIKDVLVTGIKVNHIGKDNYYGFTLDGNNRYIMGDFTVTHNTISTLNVLSQLRGKTIIIVNKIPLMNQWISEIKQFLPDAKIGIIQGQKKVEIYGCDIVVAMLQSLSKIDYPDILFSDFRVSVFDEVHNVSSRSFSKVLFKLTSKYSIGLSATPKRSDGCEYIFKWHLGDIVYEGTSERKGKTPIIRYLKINSNDYREVSMINKFTGKKTVQFTSMLSELIDMEKRNKLIIEIIKDCRKEKRRILVLSDRRNHLQTLYKNLLEKDTDFTYGLFLGSMKIIELEKSKACDVILATYAAFGEGVSEKDLDTLILTTPKKFIGHLKNTTKNESFKLEQIIGRIFRKEHTDINPMIIDFQDNFSVFRAQGNSRKVFYKQHFQNVIFQNQSINLDEHNDIKIEYIKNNKTETKIIEKEED
jgi:superfamily II DNA or RNA helicase